MENPVSFFLILPFMKLKICFSIVLFLLISVSQAQTISNARIYPPFPGPTDHVLLIADLTFPSGTCNLDTVISSISGGSVHVSLYHCLGMLAVICNASDTVDLGILTPGTYLMSLQVYTGSMTGTSSCSTHSIADQSQFSFTVVPGSSVPENSKASQAVWYDSDQNAFKIREPFRHQAEQLTIRDITGRICLSREVDGPMIRLPGGMTHGIYMFSLLTKSGQVATGKVIIR